MTSELIPLNWPQLRTIARDYEGEIVKHEPLPNELHTSAAPGRAQRVWMSTGWVIDIGQLGAVYSERRPPEPEGGV